MLSEPKDPPPIHDTIPDSQPPNPVMAGQGSSNHNPSSMLSSSGISSWAKSLSFKSPQIGAQEDSPTGNDAKSKLSRLTSGLGLRFIPAANTEDKDADAASTGSQNGVLESLKKGFVDSSKSAVKAVQVKARHMVSQNKRRYQEGGFDLDMTYITENIIAMGFPAGDLSSGFFGYVEGFYRNDMDEVVKFLETYHKGKYKVYNLCSERLYDASLFEGKAASFPFDDHNCPPLHLIPSFCQSAYSWLKEDIENVVVIHCKAGMGRTGLMIASLLLYLKFCPTSEESIDLFNQKRCIDGKGLVLPSQIRYVKYFERILRDFNGVNQPGRRCLLRGFRLHGCPYWIRPSITILNHSKVLFTTKKHPKTKDLMPEDFWINTSKKGIVVFALPGEPGLSEVTGDFKIHFQDRHGDFYCWLNTTMMENRTLLSTDELDGFDKRKLPSPKFVVEIVMIDYDGTIPKRSSKKDSPGKVSDQESSSSHPSNSKEVPLAEPVENKASRSEDRDDVFSDSDGEEKGSEASEQSQTRNKEGPVDNRNVVNLTQGTEQMSISSQNEPPHQVNVKTGTSANANKDSSAVARTPNMKSPAATDFKAMAADASVFSFGDEEDYESE